MVFDVVRISKTYLPSPDLLVARQPSQSQELDRLNSLSADKAAEDLRRGFSGHLSEAGCSDETDRLKILEEVKKSGHETLCPSLT